MNRVTAFRFVVKAAISESREQLFVSIVWAVTNCLTFPFLLLFRVKGVVFGDYPFWFHSG